MPDALSREHHLRRRAERVRVVLEALWGDQLPDAPDPVLTVLVDTVAVDDQHGVQDQLVVQGDGLSLQALAAVLADARSSATPALVPPDLRARLAGLRPAAERVVDLRATGEVALPSEATGAWEYDAREGTVSWDARGGALCGLGDHPGVAALPEWLRRGVHEQDRSLVAAALRSSAATGRPYDVRFRVAPPGRAVVLARGRVLTGPGGGVRVLGFAAEDAGAG
ncbi:hypothetical protein [Kineococcus sp. SYSU DK002]|uniref:hypothetical protein n=1 Tax=Kineococcus sp. SYSU DK002 TaxID=3383123 RepID=UPI003D7E2BC6